MPSATTPAAVKIGLIGGTGLGTALAAAEGKAHYVDTPFGKPSGPIVELAWGGATVLGLARHGAGHLLAPADVPYRANLFALKMLGCTHVLASGAVGSLREEYRPRDLVLPDQAIDRTFRRPATFFEKSAVHVDLGEPFCPVLRQILKDASGEAIRQRGVAGIDGMNVHAGGCYVAMEGPAFSTRAESLMHRLWGGDLIGMTAMPEAKLAREAELPYALVALVTDYDAWKAKPKAGDAKPSAAPPDLMDEILANLRVASENGMALLRVAVERIGRDPSLVAACPARDALARAIFSDKSRIDRDEVERLRPIWGRYFPGR